MDDDYALSDDYAMSDAMGGTPDQDYTLPVLFGQQDAMHSQRLTNGLSWVEQEANEGGLLPEEASHIRRQIMKQLGPLRQRQQAAEQQSKQKLVSDALEQQAMGRAVAQTDQENAARGFPQTFASVFDPQTATFQQYYQSEPGKWTPREGQATPDVDYMPIGGGMALGANPQPGGAANQPFTQTIQNGEFNRTETTFENGRATGQRSGRYDPTTGTFETTPQQDAGVPGGFLPSELKQMEAAAAQEADRWFRRGTPQWQRFAGSQFRGYVERAHGVRQQQTAIADRQRHDREVEARSNRRVETDRATKARQSADDAWFDKRVEARLAANPDLTYPEAVKLTRPDFLERFGRAFGADPSATDITKVKDELDQLKNQRAKLTGQAQPTGQPQSTGQAPPGQTAPPAAPEPPDAPPPSPNAVSVADYFKQSSEADRENAARRQAREGPGFFSRMGTAVSNWFQGTPEERKAYHDTMTADYAAAHEHAERGRQMLAKRDRILKAMSDDDRRLFANMTTRQQERYVRDFNEYHRTYGATK